MLYSLVHINETSPYEVVASHDTDFTSLVIIILFTEIFAAGVKIKEEQDLTI
jgi:hypothetical protein